MADDLNYLEQKAREWAGKVVNLYNTPVPAELQPTKTELLKSAKKIKDAIESITGPLTYLEPMNQLGIWPIVIGAVGVSGAVAYVWYWERDYDKFLTTVKERNKLIASGLSPMQASKVLDVGQPKSAPMFSLITPKALLLLGLGGAAFYYYKKR